jgi:DNA-binding MarR family transcriptional regulator/N-acetylglutamate synthase-like GNAT family acetyltransferase
MAKRSEKRETIRRFNRFYTNLLGLLNRKLLKSDYSLAEARILFEIGHTPGSTASVLVKQLALDPAYLSRILSTLEKNNLVKKERSREDTRKQLLSLTSSGHQALSELQQMANEQVETFLAHVSEEDQERLVQAMETIEKLLNGDSDRLGVFTFRSHRPGDIGYITYRHGVLYAEEYGFDETFEAYVAAGLAKFVENYDPTKEHLWIVEMEATIVGSIAIVNVDDHVAQLRWFLIEPSVRGKGLGKKLLHEAVGFCKRRGYRKIILWTLAQLHAARHLYANAGFQLAETKSHVIWGKDLTEELWELEL